MEKKQLDAAIGEFQAALDGKPETKPRPLVMAEAIRIAGKVEPDAIKDALLSIDGFQGVTGTYTYVSSRIPSKPVIFVKIEDGKRVFLEEYTP
jgi:branched-chain amino acid transport system substrate-binding protein